MTVMDEREEAELDERDALRQRVADRVSFDLHYKRADAARRFEAYELTGGMIDDAFGEPGKKSVGYWDCPHFEDMEDMDENGWIQEFFAVAVTEAIHEALEWFRVDGKVVINPHGADEENIMIDSGDFARKLLKQYGPESLRQVQGKCYGKDLSA